MIVCGTDLSIGSEPALKTAAALARKQEDALLLVTALEGLDSSDEVTAGLQLEQEARYLRQAFEIEVETRAVHGAPVQRLLELAESGDAKLVVVGAQGKSKRSRFLGSVPELLCQRAEVPVLVARSGESLVAWSRGTQPLKVLVGSGLGDASRSALACVGAWPDLALTVAHIAWPFGEHYRLGVGGPIPLDHLRPEVHHQLIGDLGHWAAGIPCRSSAKLSVTPGWGRIDTHLAQLAQEKDADLLVVGTHQRNLADRIWHASVSRNTLQEATCNVLCVPQRHMPAHSAAPPRMVVIPTDFSPLADRAIAHGYSLVDRGGSVHLVHVVRHLQGANGPELKGQLAARIPEDAEARGILSELHVLEGSAAWASIWQHAGRTRADLICMATHTRDAAASLVLGSQAQALLQHSRIPVLLVPPDRES